MPNKIKSNSKETKEYQNAHLFWEKFRFSKLCLQFRVAWKIPAEGFMLKSQFVDWNKNLIDKTNKWLQSEKYKSYLEKRDKMKIQVACGTASQDLFFDFARKVWLTVPLYKYQADLNDLVKRFDLPLYWFDFVEECVLYAQPEIRRIVRPSPEPMVKWDNILQCYVLYISQIFPETTIEDFRTKRFVKKYKALLKKLPGYKMSLSRSKKQFVAIEKIINLPKKTYLADYELSDYLYGCIDNDGSTETKRRNSVKKLRQRTRRLIKRQQ
ncbi:hypothetical protein IT397_02925 [Candidatus Nomurabacteria bacterium]|nr:hypothetical protein [Candidatus Nomurabacteria bacterium]